MTSKAGKKKKEPEAAEIPVFDFGCRVEAETKRQDGLWTDMGALAPKLWGPIELRLRSVRALAVADAVDKAEAEINATSVGNEEALAKVRKAVNEDAGDGRLSIVVAAAALPMLGKSTRSQEVKVATARALACLCGARGKADFGSGVIEMIGDEPQSVVQGWFEPLLAVSRPHVISLMTAVNAVADRDDREVVLLGEDSAVTEKPSGSSPDSVTTTGDAGSG